MEQTSPSGVYDLLRSIRNRIPALEEFEFFDLGRSCQNTKTLRFLSDAPSLRRLILTTRGFSVPSAPLDVPWAQMTHYHGKDRLPRQLDILSAAPNLVECRLAVYGVSDHPAPENSKGAILLPQLRRLATAGSRVLDYLSAPSLHFLRVEEGLGSATYPTTNNATAHRMAHQHQFIDCPRGCGARIPSRLICRGRNVPWHAGLEYRVCDCGFFLWLDPEAYRAAERRQSAGTDDGYGYGHNPPPPPPPSYDLGMDDPWACSPQLPSQTIASSTSFELLLPLSQQPPPSTQPPPYASQPQPSSTQLAPPSKQTCANGQCSRLLRSRNCSYKMCKTCCEQQRKGCAYAGHRKGMAVSIPSAVSSTPSSTVVGDPSLLSRPAPMFTYDVPTSSDSPSTYEAPMSSTTPSATELAPKLYSKVMSPEFAAKYNKNHEVQAKRRRAEEERREQETMLKHQVRVCFWGRDVEDPEVFREQGIPSWPKFNLAKSSSLLRKMEVAATDEIHLYDFDGRRWNREDVNHVMEVQSCQFLLMRRIGVKNCPQIDDFIGNYAPGHNKTSRKRARALSSTVDATERRTRPCLSIMTSPPSTSACPSPFEPSSASSSAPSPTTTDNLSLPSPPLLSGPSDADLDGLWKGEPYGMYARDMAKAFELVTAHGESSVPDQFKAVFALENFPKPTWYKQHRAWKNSTQAERDWAEALPRTSEGLWTQCRKSMSGWDKVSKRR
ncbi:hypothetical protein FB45DRAFT_1044412 [Roridomyces roridus]|uniref:Uncharacterized protein n=1 Tax=Roridomyces roridus TaxID=1738132 RepID=A0AAD7AXY8_9AGAR|nr:hypothetical protein FB45DRAFT_1044412 [Roridomyces roridus]